MAGGMGAIPQRPGPTLADRTAQARQVAAPRRHCWVNGPADSPGPWPGLVVEWRRDGDTWLAGVVYVVDEEHGTPVMVEQWLARDSVRPAR